MSEPKPNDMPNEAFAFLDELRASGVTNMYGAGPYVQEEFACDKRRAREWGLHWMETFESRLERGEVHK